MSDDTAPLLERLVAVRAADRALDGLGALLHQADPEDLSSIVSDLAQLHARVAAQLAVVVAAAESTGVVERSQCASTRAWIADHGWHVRSSAGTLARTAGILRRPDLEPVGEAVISLDVTPDVAVTIAEQFDKMTGHLREGTETQVLDTLIAVGAERGSREVRRRREHVLAHFGRSGSLQQEQDRCRRQLDLSPGRETADGVHHFELTLDGEGRAQLEAAIGPLSAPQPDPNGGPDTRPIGRRRAEALIEMLRRSVRIVASGQPAGVKATLMIDMGLQDLIDRLGAGRVLGTRAQDTLLAPETVRRIACDAAVIPAVLGSDDQLVNLGRQVRLFDVAQTRALWRRDRHCSFEKCTLPAAYCDAHHLVHWVDGGATDLANGALLCGRHHTVVHRDQLAGREVRGRVRWDRSVGSYRQLLTEVRRT